MKAPVHATALRSTEAAAHLVMVAHSVARLEVVASEMQDQLFVYQHRSVPLDRCGRGLRSVWRCGGRLRRLLRRRL